jgi:uncharacterized protein YqeY
MSLLQEIKDASIAARKERSLNASFPVTLYSECQNVGKSKGNRESTEEECISVLKKFKAGAENIIENAIIRGNSGDAALVEAACSEIVLIEEFLPVMLTEQELAHLIENFVSELEDKTQKQKGVVMGLLKKEYSGLYDGGQAMRIITQMLD